MTIMRSRSICTHGHPFLPFLDLVFVVAASLEVDLIKVSFFSRSIGPVPSNPLFVFAASFALPPWFWGLIWPIRGISDASHCWKGLATKDPFTSNHRVKGEEISSVLVSPLALEISTTTLYIGVCFATLEEIDSCHTSQHCNQLRTSLVPQTVFRPTEG